MGKADWGLHSMQPKWPLYLADASAAGHSCSIRPVNPLTKHKLRSIGASMHPKLFLSALSVTAVVLLAQCNKNEAAPPQANKDSSATPPPTDVAPAAVVAPIPATAPVAATPPPATTPTTPAPVAAAPAAVPSPAAAPVSNASSSVPLVSEGMSPAFRAVVSKLELGGCSFSYDEAKGAAGWAALLDEILKAAPASDRKDIPPNFSFAKLFEILGLDAMAAAGSSARQRADGSYHSRSFAYMPKGRKGLLTLTGGPASKLLLLDVAPKDTDFGLEFSLNLKDFTHEELPKILWMLPPKEQAEFNEEISQPIPNVGITTKQVLENLNLRVGLFLRLDPAQKIPVSPDMPAVTGGDGVLVIDGLAWLLNGLKPALMPMLQDPKAPVNVTEADGVLTLQLKQPAGPAPMDYQPVLRFDSKADRLLLASRPSVLEAILAGNNKFTQRADFAETWRDLPTEGNDCIFVSKRFFDQVSEFAGESSKTAKTGSASDKLIVEKMLGWTKDLFGRNQAIVLSNQPDGIMTHANLTFPANPSSMSTLATISTVSILASAAVPAFTKLQGQAQQTKEMNNARQVAIALRLYAVDHGGKYPAKLSDLPKDVLEDPSALLCKNPLTGGQLEWLYNSKLNDSSPASELLLATPFSTNGKRIGAFNDGSVRTLSDEEYQNLSREK